MKSFVKGLRNYTNFSGRTTRKDFWMFMLFTAIFFNIAMFLDMLAGTFDEETGYGPVGALYQLALIVPSWAIAIRRTHDANRIGWFVLLPFYNLYLLFVPTYPEENDWGPVPTGITESTQDDGNKKNTSYLETKLEEVQNLLKKGSLTEDVADIEEEFHENGQLKFRGNQKDGKPEGLFESFHENGQLQIKGNFKDGKREGFSEMFNENGKLIVRSNYKDGKREGLYELFDDNGQLTARKNYKDGKQEGHYELFDDNGQLTSRSNYKDGKEEGRYEMFHKNGQLKMWLTVKDGEFNGQSESFDEDGQLTVTRTYKDGKRVK